MAGTLNTREREKKMKAIDFQGLSLVMGTTELEPLTVSIYLPYLVYDPIFSDLSELVIDTLYSHMIYIVYEY